ncbi:MAG: S41 family peptidase [Faecalibacterium sp.]|jgi:carboxyl-terminal processing protease|nr:S41 family peptidase [Faecalibacterium sp.]
MNKKVSVSLLVTIVLIAMTVTFSVTMVAAMRRFDSTVSSVKAKENMYEKLSEIDRYVRDNDYYTSDENTLNDMLASGYMLGSGDKYAKYYTADAYAELLEIQNGTRMGIGADVVKDAATGYAKITKVYSGSPAEDLGMQKGCYITKIEDVEVKNLANSEAIASRLRGENGTSVNITWLNASAEENTSAVTRRSYTVSTVDYQYVENGSYGYIKIRDFTEATASELDYAINQMTSAGATSLVFDLRDNAGSNLNAAIDCIDLICPESTIASAVSSDGTVTELGSSSSESEVSLPIVCIVNGSTASGAELFAYSARALNGAKLVGSTTAGKGTIQSEPKLLTDGSAVVVTVATLQTCDGASFDGTGVTVDAERALSSDEETVYYDFTMDNDPQIQKAFSVANTLTGSSTVAATNSADAAASTAAESTAAESGASEAPAESAASSASES